MISFTAGEVGSDEVIKKDVRRTAFAKNYSTELLKLLRKVSKNFPKTGYYQGMNNIGGFLLTYTKNYKFSVAVFNFLIEKRLSKYFSEKFKNTKQLFFVCDKLFEFYLPNFYLHLQKLNIKSGEYLTSTLLTLYTHSLQGSHTHSLVANVFDIIIAENWPGFFKILIVFYSYTEKIILKLNYEKTLKFLQNDIFDHLIEFNFKDFKANVLKINIPKNLLIALEYQYEDIGKNIETFWNEYYEKRKSMRKTSRSITKRGRFNKG